MSMYPSVRERCQAQLDRFCEEWDSINVHFAGDEPPITQSLNEWDELTNLDLVTSAASDVPRAPSFAQAWHQIVGDMRFLTFDHLVPWSEAIAGVALEGCRFDQIPSPPVLAIPPAAASPACALT